MRLILSILLLSLAACEGKPSPAQVACEKIVPAKYAEVSVRPDGFGPTAGGECRWGVEMMGAYAPNQRGYVAGLQAVRAAKNAVIRAQISDSVRTAHMSAF